MGDFNDIPLAARGGGPTQLLLHHHRHHLTGNSHLRQYFSGVRCSTYRPSPSSPEFTAMSVTEREALFFFSKWGILGVEEYWR